MRKSCVLSLLLMLGTTAVGFAEDLFPPTWRNDDATQMVQYEFLQDPGAYPATGGLILPFDDWNVVGYSPAQPVLTHIPGPGAGWHALQPTFELGGTGVYNPAGDPGDGWVNLSGELIIDLENFPVAQPHKEVWIQLVWEPQAPGNLPAIVVEYEGTMTPETSIPLVQTTLWLGSDFDSANPWRNVFHSVYHIDIFPNPPDEIVHIRGGINVDELVIDTICIPEPASMSLLGLGAFLFVRRRWKART